MVSKKRNCRVLKRHLHWQEQQQYRSLVGYEEVLKPTIGHLSSLHASSIAISSLLFPLLLLLESIHEYMGCKDVVGATLVEDLQCFRTGHAHDHGILS